MPKECLCLDALVLRTRYRDAEIATRSYVTLCIIMSRLLMRRWSRGASLGPSAHSSATRGASVVSCGPLYNPSLDCFHFVYICNGVAVEAYSKLGPYKSFVCNRF